MYKEFLKYLSTWKPNEFNLTENWWKDLHFKLLTNEEYYGYLIFPLPLGFLDTKLVSNKKAGDKIPIAHFTVGY